MQIVHGEGQQVDSLSLAEKMLGVSRTDDSFLRTSRGVLYRISFGLRRRTQSSGRFSCDECVYFMITLENVNKCNGGVLIISSEDPEL